MANKEKQILERVLNFFELKQEFMLKVTGKFIKAFDRGEKFADSYMCMGAVRVINTDKGRKLATHVPSAKYLAYISSDLINGAPVLHGENMHDRVIPFVDFKNALGGLASIAFLLHRNDDGIFEKVQIARLPNFRVAYTKTNKGNVWIDQNK